MDNCIICKQGICFIKFSSPNKIMICGSLMNAIYFEMPPKRITLDIQKYKDNIILLDNIFLEECEMTLDILSRNSCCLRIYEKNIRGTQDYFVGFKINESTLLEMFKFL